MKLSEINTILWDWNGTLLNDMSLCIRSMNRLLKKRKLPSLCTDRYLEIFNFPVKDYYQKLGFDFTHEVFEIPAEEFIVHYNEGISQVPLFEDVCKTLTFFQQNGIRQYIISAMEHNALIESVESRNILHFFEKVRGINDNLAYGKTDLAKKLIREESIDLPGSIFVGDTLHDAEVANEIKVQNVLISRGHQHRNRLIKTGNPVLNSLSEFVEYVKS